MSPVRGAMMVGAGARGRARRGAMMVARMVAGSIETFATKASKATTGKATTSSAAKTSAAKTSAGSLTVKAKSKAAATTGAKVAKARASKAASAKTTTKTTTKGAKTAKVAAPDAPQGVNRVLPHVSAQKFPLHASIGDMARKMTAKPKPSAPPPPTSSGNRVLAHVSAPKFPLHGSIVSGDAAVKAASKVSAPAPRVPMSLSKKPGVPSGAAPLAESTTAAAPNRSRMLAAAGAALVAFMAYTMSDDDDDEYPTSKPSGKKKPVKKTPPPPPPPTPVAKAADVVNVPKPAKAAEEASAPKTETPDNKIEGTRVTEAKAKEEDVKAELADAFSAAADFLANVPEPEHAKVVVPDAPKRDNASIVNSAKDLTAASLFAAAMDTLGSTVSEDEAASAYRGMKLQADADVKVFQDLAASMVQNFERVVDVERSATDELIAAIGVLESRANEATSRLEADRARFSSELELAKANAAAEKAQSLKTQESELKAKHADFLVAERIERIKALDDERLRMGALKTVLKTRREALERSHATQRFELAVMDLSTRLDDGESFVDTIALLKTCAKDDAFVATIVNSIDKPYAKDGVPTRLQLAEQLEHVRTIARQLALVPQDGAGIFAHGLAYTASLLRMKDTSEEGAQGIEGAIARAETDLANGELVSAAKALEDAAAGTKASTTVGAWAKNARARAEIEQAQAALSAHATCRASALV